jgi:hypothetical protein
MTFALVAVSNEGDQGVTVEAIEVTAEGGELRVLRRAHDLVRSLRGDVELYDTETYEEASALLDAVASEPARVDAGASVVLLVGGDHAPPTPATVVAVGSFGRLPLLRR